MLLYLQALIGFYSVLIELQFLQFIKVTFDSFKTDVIHLSYVMCLNLENVNNNKKEQSSRLLPLSVGTS